MILLIGWVIVTVLWFLFGLVNFTDMRKANDGFTGDQTPRWSDDEMREAARFTLAAPLWPLVALHYAGRWGGKLFGSIVYTATRKTD